MKDLKMLPLLLDAIEREDVQAYEFEIKFKNGEKISVTRSKDKEEGQKKIGFVTEEEEE